MSKKLTANIIIKPVQSAPRDDLVCLYKEAGWWDDSWGSHPEFLDSIAQDSSVFVGAFLKKELIGMGRALSDLSSDAYIQDVTVKKEFRGKGIGKKIIKTLIKQLKKNGVDWIGLVAQPGTSSFYKSLGFEVLKEHVPLKYRD